MSLPGLTAALILACFTAGKDLVSKKIATSLTVTLSAFASFAYAIPYYLVMLVILWLWGAENFAVQHGFFLLITLRCCSDVFAEWTKLASISRADISLVSAFQSLSPAFLAIFSPLITGDPLTAWSCTGLLIISVAGILLAQPFKRSAKSDLEHRKQLSGLLYGVACAFFFSINHCLDRLAAQTASAPLSAFAMTLLAALFFLPAVLFNLKSSFSDLRISSRPLFARGAFEVIGMTAKLFALQYLTAPTVVAVARLAVPLSIICGAILYQEHEMGRRLLLGSIMVGGSLLTMF